jgi:beta-exotoxin I transport system permease protein
MTTTTETMRAPQKALEPPSALRVFRALVLRGLRDRRKAPLTWGGSLAALCAFEVAIWPSIESSIGKAVANYPKGLKEAFGIADLNTVEAYLDAEMFSLIMPLAITFFAVRCVASILSAAEEQSHLDTLLSAPVPRRVLAGAAMGVTAPIVAAVLLVVGVLTWVVGGLVGAGLSAGPLAGGLLAVWALSMLFAGVATLGAGVLHRSALVTALGMGTAVAMYVIDLVGKLADGAEPLRWVSAFKYYDAPLRDGVDLLACAGLLAVGLACAAAGALLFDRRDVL